MPRDDKRVMLDADFERIKRYIRKRVRYWKPILGLVSWTITTDYYTEPWDHNIPHALMDVRPDWRYMTANIRVNVKKIFDDGMKKRAIDRVVIEELLHMQLYELRAAAPKKARGHILDHEERVVTHLVNAIVWTHTEGWNAGRKHLRKQQKRDRAKQKQQPRNPLDVAGALKGVTFSVDGEPVGSVETNHAHAVEVGPMPDGMVLTAQDGTLWFAPQHDAVDEHGRPFPRLATDDGKSPGSQ